MKHSSFCLTWEVPFTVLRMYDMHIFITCLYAVIWYMCTPFLEKIINAYT